MATRVAVGQQITVSSKTSLELQQESLAKQRASVERQLAAARPKAFGHSDESSPRNRTVSFSEITSFAPVEWPQVAFPLAPAFDCPALPFSAVDQLVRFAAKREEVSPDLLKAVMKRESSFHPCAISDKGALGLMQLMPSTAEQFGVDDPFNPSQNIRGGAAFLKQLLHRFGGDVRLALGAYNAGPERVEAVGGIPDIAETQEYVSAISADLHLPAPTPDSGAAAGTAQAAVSNTMAKPDLRHLTLPSTLDFAARSTPVHLVNEEP